LQILRQYRRPLLRCLAQTRNPALAHHVHRAQRLGKWVLINEDAYKSIIETQAQMAALRTVRESLKREPAWNFSRLSDKQLRSRRRRVEQDLVEQEQSTRQELEDLRLECERLSALQRRWESKHRGAKE